MLLLVCAFLLGAFQIAHAADPDPLQDFCVADLSPTAPSVNGFPCKPRSNVTAKDFTYTGFRQPGELVCAWIKQLQSVQEIHTPQSHSFVCNVV